MSSTDLIEALIDDLFDTLEAQRGWTRATVRTVIERHVAKLGQLVDEQGLAQQDAIIEAYIAAQEKAANPEMFIGRVDAMNDQIIRQMMQDEAIEEVERDEALADIEDCVEGFYAPEELPELPEVLESRNQFIANRLMELRPSKRWRARVWPFATSDVIVTNTNSVWRGGNLHPVETRHIVKPEEASRYAHDAYVRDIWAKIVWEYETNTLRSNRDRDAAKQNEVQ